ncbi:hypothetical protein Ccrd_009479 [Cynara cardunculus var. scolymus]|uniref:Uncharacterized protein n=1 Tax=Cynara cardunculus var. scolymus TaxID=59895 RepID=A0A103YN53_CYNCS|nr:hypothetical protein Ccrd_009479 [Cynara cardunculus var. scolymus]
MNERFKNLTMEFTDLGNVSLVTAYGLSFVGTFVTDRPINFHIMKHRLANLWRSWRGFLKCNSDVTLFRNENRAGIGWSSRMNMTTSLRIVRIVFMDYSLLGALQWAVESFSRSTILF